MPAARMIKTAPEEVGLTSKSSVEVHNLPRGVTESEVEGLFPGLDVQQVVLLRGPDLGCALVEFSDSETADAAEKSTRRFALRGAPVIVRKPRVAIMTSGSGQTFALAPGARTASSGVGLKDPVAVGSGSGVGGSSSSMGLPVTSVSPSTAATSLFGLSAPVGNNNNSSSSNGGLAGSGGGSAADWQSKDVPDYSSAVSALSYLLQADDDLPDLSFGASDLTAGSSVFQPSASVSTSSSASLFSSSLFASPFLTAPADVVPPPPGFDAPAAGPSSAASPFGAPSVGNLFPGVGSLWGSFGSTTKETPK